MIPAQRRRRRISAALAVVDGLGGVVSSDRKGTHAVLGAYRATPRGRRSLVARAGLVVAVALVCGLGGVSTPTAAAAVPTYAWAIKGGGTSYDEASGVSARANGSSIITGYFTGTATFGSTTLTSAGSADTFTAKVNANGTYAWATKGGGTGDDYASDVSVRANGSSIITGYFMGTAIFGSTTLTSAGSTDTFTAKLNANGTYAWATRGGGAGEDYAYGVSARANGSSIITGFFRGTAIFGTTTLTSAGSNDAFMAKLNANGTYAWAIRVGGSGAAGASGVSALANGSSIITGSFTGTATFGTTTPLISDGSSDTFTAKVNANGTYAWATRGEGTGNEYTYGVSARANGSSIITGYFMGTATFGTTTLTSAGSTDTFTAKLNANGTYAWATKGGGTGDDSARGVSVRANGSSIITGSFNGNATFGTTTLTGGGAFMAKLNANGTYAWAIRVGGSGAAGASGVSALANGSSIITGSFTGTAIFGVTTLTSSGGSTDTFTARIVAS